MYRIITRFIFASMLLFAVSCTKEMDPVSMGALKLSGIRVEVANGENATKAVEALADSVGRTSFQPADVMHFTSIRRTENSLSDYTYTNIKFSYSDKKAWDTKDKTKDIYWTDATSLHTFIGYSLPNVTGFDWEMVEGDDEIHYYGSVGSKNGTGLLKFAAPPAPTTPGDPETTYLAAEDLFLTYHNDLTHSDAVAFVNAHHALSSMRVTVQISGFSTSENDNDHRATVNGLVVKNQPVKYVWDQTSYTATAGARGGETQTYRDMELYLPHPKGKNPGKTSNAFVFYGITAPHTEAASPGGLQIEFYVDYPDPMGGTEPVHQKYAASIPSVKFDAGYCTSIIINLNHKDETITVGASYNDWIYVDTPDYGDLDRIQVFLHDVSRDRIKIHSDHMDYPAEDATWLYEKTTGTGTQIVDIYGHDGSETDPYMIRTADQFLSFAYEVNVSNDGAGWDFANKFISLDSGLILQPNNNGNTVLWPGIGVKTTPGVDSETDRPFNGHLMGGVRLIKRLKGNPLFGYIGPTGHVDQLLLEDVLDIDGAAAYATQNDGIICAGKVASVVGESFSLKTPISISGIKLDETDNFTNINWGSPANYENGTTTVAAPFVAYNNGVILACYCVGDIRTGAARNSGIVGYNNGAMVVDYSAVKAAALTDDAAAPFFRGTVAYNRYHPDFFNANPKPHPDNIPYQTLKFSNKAVRIFDYSGSSDPKPEDRQATFSVTGLKSGKTMNNPSYRWGVKTGSSYNYTIKSSEYAEIISDTNTETITVQSKHGKYGETFFCVKVSYTDENGQAQEAEDYVRVMSAVPLLEPTRLVGNYAGKLTYCFFDYQVSGVDPTLALGQVYGYTTAQMQSRSFIGSPDYSNTDTRTLNGTIHTFASEANAGLIPASMMEGYKYRYGESEDRVHTALVQLSAHCMARYYVFHAASYPWVY